MRDPHVRWCESLTLFPFGSRAGYSISSSAIVQNEQVALYFQFDDDEPIEGVKCNGNEFTMKMLPVENGFVEFTDGKKKFRMFVRHCY